MGVAAGFKGARDVRFAMVRCWGCGAVVRCGRVYAWYCAGYAGVVGVWLGMFLTGRARRTVLLASGKRALAVEIRYPRVKRGVKRFCRENHQGEFNRSVE